MGVGWSSSSKGSHKPPNLSSSERTTLLCNGLFKECLGMEVFNQQGYFVGNEMGRMVHSFQNWLEYPKGDRVLKGHSGLIKCVVVSSDGMYAYTGDEDGRLMEWDLIGMTRNYCWRRKNDCVSCVDYCPRNMLIAAYVDRFPVILYDTHTRKIVHKCEGHTQYVTALAFDEDGHSFFSGSLDKSVRQWSVNTGECARVFIGHTDRVNDLICLDHTTILTSSLDYSLRQWDLSCHDSGIALFSDSLGTWRVNCDRTWIIRTFSTRIYVYSWPKLEKIREINVSLLIDVCCPHPTLPHLMAIGGGRGDLTVVDLQKDTLTLCIFFGSKSRFCDLCFTPDGTRMISVGEDMVVQVWDTSDLR